MDATIAAIAVAPTFSQMAFSAKLGIDFPLLSDWDGEVSSAFGIQYNEWKGHVGVSKRSLFVIGSFGQITYSWWTDDAEELPDLDRMLTALAATT